MYIKNAPTNMIKIRNHSCSHTIPKQKLSYMFAQISLMHFEVISAVDMQQKIISVSRKPILETLRLYAKETVISIRVPKYIEMTYT